MNYEQIKQAAYVDELEKIALSRKLVDPIISEAVLNIPKGFKQESSISMAHDLFKKMDKLKLKYPLLAGDRATPMMYLPSISAIKRIKKI